MGIALESQVSQNKFSAALNASCVSSDTVLFLTALPTASSGYLVIDEGLTTEETIYYSSKGSNFVTVPSTAYRGLSYSANGAQPHANNASVKMKIVSQYLEDLRSGESNTGMHTYWNEGAQPYVQSGCVWSTVSGLNGTMTSGVVYIGGRRLTVATVASRAFTASKDTYIDLLASTTDNTASVVYTEVANNAASPALAASSVRIGICVSGASITSWNQGSPTAVLPIASSVAYSVTDSLGNLIYPAAANPTLIGYRQIVANFTIASSQSTQTQVTGLSVPVIVPAGRKVKICVFGDALVGPSGTAQNTLAIWDGVVASGTKLSAYDVSTVSTANNIVPLACSAIAAPATSSKTYNVGLATAGGSSGNLTFSAGSATPAYVSVELV